jgi:hypothetical protein
MHTIANGGPPGRRAQVARDGRWRIGYQWWMLRRARAGPPPDSRPSIIAVRRRGTGSSPDRRPGRWSSPACAGRLSWRGQVADEYSPWRSGVPAVTGPRWPPLVCGLLVFAVLSCLCPSRLPPARKPDCGKLPMLTRTNPGRRLHAEIPAWADANLIHLRHKERHPPHAAHAVSGQRIGAAFKEELSRPVDLLVASRSAMLAL